MAISRTCLPALIVAFALLVPADGWGQVEIGKLRELVHDGQVGGVAFSLDGSRIATWGYDYTCRTWDASTGKAMDVLKFDVAKKATFESATSQKLVKLLAWDKSTWLVRRSSADGLETWDPAKKKLGPAKSMPSQVVAHRVRGPQTVLMLLADDPDRGASSVLDLKTGKRLCTLNGLSEKVAHADFSADGQRLLTYCRGTHATQVWDLTTGKQLWKLDDEDVVTGLAISADGKRAITGQANLRIWNLETGEEGRQLDPSLQRSGGVLKSAAITPDGQRALTLSIKSGAMSERVAALRLLDLNTGDLLAQVERPNKYEAQADLIVELSPDGLLAVTYHGRLRSVYENDTRAATIWQLPPADGKK